MALQLLSGPTDTRLLPAEFRYSADDPLAVTVVFDVGSESPVQWVFARDLLSTGLKRETGLGDVVVGPVEDAHGVPAVKISLSSPDGDALLLAPAAHVDEFVAHTCRLVPPGTEGQLLDIDLALGSLLDGA
ncbi:SsgA family sporulation/cell division regulator [Phytoactinopolyspora halophila]|nr:SsgA family sporulation/cell division regulator [Phytoactinopolyspora halophila]